MKKETAEQRKKRIRRILRILNKMYPNASCHLTFRSPFELLIKTILSAQCTDERVNRIGEDVFRRFPSPQDFATSDPEQISEAIYSAGFYRHKARLIKSCCQKVIDDFHGQVPDTMEELLQLPGVGRKTANAILGACFGGQGIIVDTHVIRLSQRLFLSNSVVPDKIEKDLQGLIPRRRWTLVSNQLSEHGRQVCLARVPRCPDCPLVAECAYAKKKEKNI